MFAKRVTVWLSSSAVEDNIASTIADQKPVEEEVVEQDDKKDIQTVVSRVFSEYDRSCT